MTSKAQRLRNKRARAGLPELAKIPSRRRTGDNLKSRELRDQEDATRVVLEARARQMGVPLKKAGDMRDQFLGEGAGMAIALVCGYTKKNGLEETKRLYQLFNDLKSAEDRYHKTNGVSVYPKCAKLEVAPEKMEAKAEDVVDLRTEEEKADAARKRWDYWCKIMNGLGLGHSSAIHTARQDFAPLVSGGIVTIQGARFVAAMREMDRLMGMMKR